MAKDTVKAAIGVGEVMPVAASNSGCGGVPACQPGILQTNIKPMDFSWSKRREFSEQCTGPASDFQGAMGFRKTYLFV